MAPKKEPVYTLNEIRRALGVEIHSSDWRPHPSDQELLKEDFKDRSRVHDWRNYVNQERWTQLTYLERLVQYAEAYKTAMAEEWD